MNYLERACEEIDAALYSSDDFSNPATMEMLKEYIRRWTRRIVEIQEEIEIQEPPK